MFKLHSLLCALAGLITLFSSNGLQAAVHGPCEANAQTLHLSHMDEANCGYQGSSAHWPWDVAEQPAKWVEIDHGTTS